MPRRSISSANELGYAEVTSSVPVSPFINSQSYMAIPGYSYTVQATGSPLLVTVQANVQQVTVNLTGVILTIFEDGVDVGPGAACFINAQFNSQTPFVQVRRTPAAGAHTYALYGKVSNAANTAWLVATGTNRGFIRITRA